MYTEVNGILILQIIFEVHFIHQKNLKQSITLINQYLRQFNFEAVLH